MTPQKLLTISAMAVVFGVMAPTALAAPTYAFQWQGTFNNEPSPYKSNQWFGTVDACHQDLLNREHLYSNDTVQVNLTCFCSTAIYLQPSCPDFASASAQNSGQIPQGGACAPGSDQCAANLTCSTGGTCVIKGTQTSGTDTSGTQTSGTQTGAGTYAGDGTSVTLMNPLGQGATVSSLITSILKFVVQLGSIVVILMLVYIGFLFVTAQGEPSKLTQAREALMWTVVGALILLGAEAIAQGIQATVSALSTGG